MKSWKITLKNGTVLHKEDYHHIYISDKLWTINKLIKTVENNNTGYLWWKNIAIKEVIKRDPLLEINADSVLMAEWAEVETAAVDKPKATDPAKPSNGGILGWAKPVIENKQRDKHLYDFGWKTPKLSKLGKKKFKEMLKQDEIILKSHMLQPFYMADKKGKKVFKQMIGEEDSSFEAGKDSFFHLANNKTKGAKIK
jgi:hypothetical protein